MYKHVTRICSLVERRHEIALFCFSLKSTTGPQKQHENDRNCPFPSHLLVWIQTIVWRISCLRRALGTLVTVTCYLDIFCCTSKDIDTCILPFRAADGWDEAISDLIQRHLAWVWWVSEVVQCRAQPRLAGSKYHCGQHKLLLIIIIIFMGAFTLIFPNQLKVLQGWKLCRSLLPMGATYNMQITTLLQFTFTVQKYSKFSPFCNYMNENFEMLTVQHQYLTICY